MGYFEDYDENRIDYFESKYVFQDLTDKWVTREGKTLELTDMATLHLVNCSHMIIRICINEGWDTNSFTIYRNILKELDRRDSLI